jgi:hypothetical protein
MYQTTRRTIKQIVVIIEAYHFCQLCTKFYPALKVNCTCRETIGNHQCEFRPNRSTTDHISCIRQILEKEWEYNDVLHKLFVDFKKGRSCIMFSLSLLSHETGKANNSVSE